MNQHIAISLDPRFHTLREFFEVELAVIQQKHDFWFRSRVNMTTGEYPDKIYNYYRYYYTHDHKVALYLKESLQFEIRQECIVAFNKLFHSD